ncbi:uncharacterized protein BCR38DRAFT_337589 [Pseudomassariella vexata]|uniref:Hypersensitive response-inducing protein n=1 Tax=Pseudomassariella vexata TaxID=1141098 RepID=A0A1Y2E7I8_9PEZI|nr:uncharacterized protein BCR38DRAFT_337589 [Pseudomassariella vexata]ORY67528.1 hypothetical protein BCR38DRAFT_337589 [Pseudomassariella vexata]
MQFSIILALAASASAATLQRRQAQTYPIADFSADCIPHSNYCSHSYNFTVNSDPSLSPSHCSAFVQGPDQLPAVEEGTCSDNVGYTWSIEPTSDGGLDFAIWYAFNARSNITYCASIPASQITTETDGTANTQHYTGPKNLTASISECPA